MIHEALQFFKDNLDDYLVDNIQMTHHSDRVDFVALTPPELTFKEKCVTLLMINVEEERLLRPPNPYIVTGEDGIVRQVSPPLRLDIMLLFAANFQDYYEAVKHISWVVQYFQRNPVFSAPHFPGFPVGIDRLIMELHSLTSSQLNEIWSMLKTAYLPSVVYKARLLAYQDEIPAGHDVEISDIPPPRLRLR